MLNVIITVYLVVFALMMRKDLEEEMERIDNTSRPFAWHVYAAIVVRWFLWPILSLGQLIYITVKIVRK